MTAPWSVGLGGQEGNGSVGLASRAALTHFGARFPLSKPAQAPPPLPVGTG